VPTGKQGLEVNINDITSGYVQRHPREQMAQLYRDIPLDAMGDDRSMTRGETLLHLAARHVDFTAVQILLERGIDASQQDAYGATPLHYLAEYNSNIVSKPAPGDIYKTADLLIKGKVSALRKNDRGNTCYLLAAERGNGELVQALVDNGVRVTMTGEGENTGLHLACTGVRRAIENLELSRQYLAQTKDAEVPRQQEMVERCQAECDEAVQAVERYFLTVQAFIKGGVPIDAKNSMLETAPMLAIRAGAKKIAALLTGTYSEQDDEQAQLLVQAGGMTLHRAVYQRDAEAVEALLKLGAGVNEISDEHEGYGGLAGNTPLALAMRPPFSLPLLEGLLKAGADPNLRNNKGCTALSFLFTHDLDMRLDPQVFENNAVGKLLQLFKQHGGDLDAEVNADLDTLLCLAIRSPYGNGGDGRNRTFKQLVINALLKQGANANRANGVGGTPLMYCCQSRFGGMDDIQISLLEAGADVTARDKKGATALHYAAQNESRSMAQQRAELLFDFGKPDVAAVDNTGTTALAIAAESENEPLVKLLLAKM
jgi:ankyrin repeat protein